MIDVKQFSEQCQNIDSIEEYRVAAQILNDHYNRLNKIAQLSFNVGDSVRFEDKEGKVVHGTITKRLKKNLRVKTDTGAQWTVSPCLLTKDICRLD